MQNWKNRGKLGKNCHLLKADEKSNCLDKIQIYEICSEKNLVLINEPQKKAHNV